MYDDTPNCYHIIHAMQKLNDKGPVTPLSIVFIPNNQLIANSTRFSQINTLCNHKNQINPFNP